MMGYASKEDIDDLYGTDLLVRIADYDRDGVPDPLVIQRGLDGADEICDAYLSSQYTVPVVPTPGIVKNCAIDIAVYKIALGRTGRTDEMRVRYEDALAILEKISTGKVGLGLPPVTTTGTDANGNPVITTTNPNVTRGGRSFDCGRA
ncbi:gp436 family protein [Bradyrhizobium sp. HKCCYLS1011]|uniref:gp436 family protein n=1 Tax=Bradyrhizobium sp. HKCCYLS1011 TaxID=3420733 RepID=UPI003EBD5413